MSRLHQKALQGAQSTAELRSRLVPLETKATLDRDGLPKDGSRHGSGFTIRAISRGEGKPFNIRNPLGRVPSRVQSWDGSSNAGFDLSRSTKETIRVTPGDVSFGRTFVMIVE